MKRKHTKESWSIFQERDGNFVITAGEKTLCMSSMTDIEDGIVKKEEAKANAKLIAASPELLEIAFDLHQLITQKKQITPATLSKLKRVINKAL